MVSGNFADACIMNGTCKQGITGTFWMKFDAGDFIFTTTRSADQGEAGFARSLKSYYLF